MAPLSRASSAFLTSLAEVSRATFWLWVLGGTGAAALWPDRWPAATRAFLTGLLVSSFLCMCPGFYFRQHYFILILPAVALLAGITAASGERLLARALPRTAARTLALGVFAAAAASYVAAEREFLFSMSPRDLSRVR